MYAIIQTGGKQYRVSEGDRLKVELLEDAGIGDSVRFTDIRLIGSGSEIKTGRPTLADAAVTARVVNHGRHPKIIIFKHKRRKGYRLKKGHRQFYTEVEVTGITG